MALSLALAKIFPLTFSLLSKSEAKALKRKFEKDWNSEQLHFFPMLVRDLKMKIQIIEVADYEYLNHWLKTHSFSAHKTSAPFQLNPSVQVVWIEAAAEILKQEPGLYVLWKWMDNVFNLKVSQEEAALLDRLREDQILLRTELRESQQKILDHLIHLKIVLEALSQTELNS